LKKINEHYGKDILKQHSIRAMIKFYFDNHSIAYFKNQFFVFFSQVVLFVLQLTILSFHNVNAIETDIADDMQVLDKYKDVIRGLNSVQLCLTFYFIYIEYF
jgi:hypothetical protein